ncbi:PAS domain S-box [Belliella baltica DSM 15883]|uniref:histidine kinase n=2 Tax=Belliella TaxID=232244 RepID=I3Z7B7_BELBD|nr:PAS domain S-box [Belliella baltica DSM 15883]
MGDFLLISEYLAEQFNNLEIEHVTTCKQSLTKDPHEYDVILLDLSLPDKSGEDLVYEIIKFAENIPVIVLTGYSDKKFAIKSIGLGTADYLLKDELNPDILQKSITYSIERKKVFNQLEDSEKRYRELFQLSPLPMYVFDKSSFRFLDVNKAAISHYGYSKEEFLSMTVFDIRPVDEIERAKDIIQNEENTGMKTPGVFKHFKKNGEQIDVEISYNEIDFEDKRALLVLANDVTLKFQHIAAIEKQNEKLKEIAWIQSHVVRAPLARLMGLVNLISMTEDSDPEIDKNELLQHILNSTEELDKIIRDITNKTEQINIDKIQ